MTDRPWLSEPARVRIEEITAAQAGRSVDELGTDLDHLVAENHRIHDVQCINLNPATNVMNPKAEAMLAAGLGTRASLGNPGDKYETGLEAIEAIEVMTTSLAADVFGARYAEIRVGSGALANLYAFMATCRPGDTIIAPPADIGGHITHHLAGAAGRYGLHTVPAPIAVDGYTVDVTSLRVLARQVRPRLLTLGGSLNLFPHPIADVRAIADEVGARLLVDAAHMCGPIAGGSWPNPLAEGAHLMTMSTYKSLGGPPGGLVVTNDTELAGELNSIAYPGLTANSDAGRIAALAVTLLDWKAVGSQYAAAMIATAIRLAAELPWLGVPVFAAARGGTNSHQFAVMAHQYGGGQKAARRLRQANLLACGIGLPVPAVDGDLPGLRLGTAEVTRLGMTEADMPQLADLLARGLDPDVDPADLAPEVTEWRANFSGIHFVR